MSRIPRIFGAAPIHPVPFVLAKVLIAVIIAVPLAQAAGLRIADPVEGTVPLSIVLIVAAFVLLAVASRTLGRALRVGLPREETTLATSGIYRFSRHPIYLGLFLLAVGVCLYCPHPLVIASAVVTVVIHHAIALSEERFLEQRFGEAWLRHKAMVPRYLGVPRRDRRTLDPSPERSRDQAEG